ncbi:MAG: dicarboxylate/amino acid:cation symporter [Acidobacteria bacterium]|nr:MAG: dicarboxylate/amino acid:cation symporter [Acidobacteriota bacterium]
MIPAREAATGATAARSSYASAISVIAGLVAGVLLGILASVSAVPWLVALVRVLEPVGVIFVNAIRMAVVPLVVASLIGGIVSITDERALTRLGVRSLIVFAALAVSAAIFATVFAAPILARFEIDPSVAEGLRASASAGSPAQATAPGFAQWFTDLVPANPIRAAADGAMLPLIIFTLGLGVALTKVTPERRAGVVQFFNGLADAMMVLVGWVIRLAPIGVFALAAPLAARMGFSAAGALLSYILLAALLTVVVLAVLLYPATAFFGGVSIGRLARACAPAQAVALSSRSTMASLPAMLDAARTLGVSDRVRVFVVPLAASMLRVGSAVGQTVAVLFAARLFNVSIAPLHLVAILFVTILTTFTVPGIPGGSIVVMVPILLAANVPADAVGILLGADVIPDMFRTMANVTGGIAAAAIVDRSENRSSKEEAL